MLCWVNCYYRSSSAVPPLLCVLCDIRSWLVVQKCLSEYLNHCILSIIIMLNELSSDGASSTCGFLAMMS